MPLTILQASEYAFDILKSTPTTLIVHSVYRKAVNLKAGNQLLTLQPRGSVLSPISLITDCTEEELAEIICNSAKILDVEIDHGRGEGSGNPSAVFSLRLPTHQPHSDVLVSVSGLDCVYTVEEF